jgi:hypothetical protein
MPPRSLLGVRSDGSLPSLHVWLALWIRRSSDPGFR